VTPKCELRSQPYYHLFGRRNSERISFRFSRVCSFCRSVVIPTVSLSVYVLTSRQQIARQRSSERHYKTDAAPRYRSDPRCHSVHSKNVGRVIFWITERVGRLRVGLHDSFTACIFGLRLPASFLVDGKAAINVASTIVPPYSKAPRASSNAFEHCLRQFVPQSRCRKHKIVVSSGIGS
jgi:hypothetical protein